MRTIHTSSHRYYFYQVRFAGRFSHTHFPTETD